MQVILKFN